MSNIELRKNMLLAHHLEDGETFIERILWIAPDGNYIVTIDIDRKNKHALPIWKTREVLEDAFAMERVSIVRDDPWAVLLYPTDKNQKKDTEKQQEKQKKHQEYRDRAWEAIKSLVTDKSGGIFDPRQRGPLIAALARKEKEGEEGKEEKKQKNGTGQNKKERKGFIYNALRRYWQGGQTKNALLPFFSECGAEGKEREGKERKLGRPSPLARKEDTPAGIILTNGVRSKLLRGYKKYYISGKEKTLEKAHQRVLETFFNVGFNEVGTPILPSADQLPSIRQFTYIHEKYQDITQSLISREGERRFALRHRAILGDSTQMAFGPGSLYQGDATIGDIYLVSSRNRSRLIGRPSGHLRHNRCLYTINRRIQRELGRTKLGRYDACAIQRYS